MCTKMNELFLLWDRSQAVSERKIMQVIVEILLWTIEHVNRHSIL